MANDGYPNFPAPQSSFAVAPPLGHVPPPPPSRPPPYPHMFTIPQPIDPTAGYSQYYNISYDQQTTEQTSDEKDKQNSPAKTVGEISTRTNAQTPSMDDNRETMTTDKRAVKDTDPVEVTTPPTEDKYKSDEGLKMKFSGGFLNKKRPNPSIAVQLKPQVHITSTNKKSKTESSKISIAQAFGSDSDDDDVEEMPRSAKLRMRNIGKDTPTSAGPNSFNKTNKGFTDHAATFKKQYGL